jgi:hypothetical protein
MRYVSSDTYLVVRLPHDWTCVFRSLGGVHSDAVQHPDEMAACVHSLLQYMCLRARPVAVHVTYAACLDLETGWVLDAC